MSTPSEPGARPDDAKGADRSTSGDEPPFDPYRYGKPDRPIPREYWPPGYVPDPEPESQAGPGPYPSPNAYPYGAPPYGQQHGPPYGQQHEQPYEQPYGQPYGQQHGYPPASGPPYGAQYGTPPYGSHQQPPAPYGYGQPRPSTTKAVLSLVFGIASIVLCWLSILDAVAIIPAFVLGILALSDAKGRNGAGKGLAIAGIVCAVAGAVLAVTATILFQNAVDKCGGPAQRDDPGFTRCVQDNIF